MANIFSRILSGMTTPKKVSPFVEQGVSGTATYGGYVSTNEKSSKWVGQERYRTAADIAVNISIVAASVHYFLNMIAHPKWTIKPSDENDAEAEELAEFVYDTLHKMETPWPRVVRRAGMYRFHGFNIQEWTAKKLKEGEYAGRIGLLDVEPRPQFTIEQWQIDETGAVEGVGQRSPQTGKLLWLPRSKIIYLKDDTLSDSPEGLGIFRSLAEPYERLKAYLELEARGFERDLRGTPIGRVPYTLINRAIKENAITPEKAQQMVQGMEDFVKTEIKKSNTAITLDSMPYESTSADGLKVSGVPQWGIELLTGGVSGLGELDNAVERIQREMSRILGTEHLMMGDQGGNRALAVDKSRNFYLIANAVLSNIAAQFDKDLLTPIWKLNNFPEEKKPTMEVEDVAFKDVSEATAALAQMAQAGAVLAPDDPAVDAIRDLLGLPKSKPMTPEMMGVMNGTLDADGNPIPQDPNAPPGAGEDPPVDDDEANAGTKKPKGNNKFGKRRKTSRFIETGDGLIIEFEDK